MFYCAVIISLTLTLTPITYCCFSLPDLPATTTTSTTTTSTTTTSTTTTSIVKGSKFMILNGFWSNSLNVEIIDLNNATFSCNKFPKTDEMNTGVAGIVEGTPIWCGGYDGSPIDHCEKLDLEDKVWKHAVDLKEAKYKVGKGSIIVDGKLMVSGGYNGKSRLDAIEMVSLSSKTISNFKLPVPSAGHCNIQLNETNYMITGGFPSGRKTFVQNMETGTITNGPNMNDGRDGHACTKFQLNEVNYALVLGGSWQTSVEYLNLDQKDAQWINLNIETVANDVREGGYLLTHLNNVYLFGGFKNGDGFANDDIMKLVCADTIDTCKFVEHGNFQYGRSGHSVIPIPDEIVAKFC